jgi:hypothetical protein
MLLKKGTYRIFLNRLVGLFEKKSEAKAVLEPYQKHPIHAGPGRPAGQIAMHAHLVQRRRRVGSSEASWWVLDDGPGKRSADGD